MGPSDVLGRLRACPDFARFEEQSLEGLALKHSVWRLMEAWLLSVLSGVLPRQKDGSVSCAQSGHLTQEAETVLRFCLEALGLDLERQAQGLSAFREEWPRETPYRVRFFEMLAARVLKAGRPLILFPIVHHIEGEPCVEIKDAWAWRGISKGRLRAVVSGEKPCEWQGSVEAFSRRFVRENFS